MQSADQPCNNLRKGDFSMPTRHDWISFEGVHATKRGAAMVQEARRLFKARTGHAGPGISQGGKSGSVAASGGTHSREAFDFRTRGWSTHLQHAWEDALWQVGFAAWHRPHIAGLWPEHTHAIPKNGDLSPAAQSQERAFRNRRSGLRSNASYPRIGKYADRTWEKYRATRPKPKPLGKVKISGKYYPDIPYVSLWWLLKARKEGYRSRHVWYVQKWLTRLGFYKAPRDGKWGPVTQAAYDNFRRSLRLQEKDATGSPGWGSLQALAKKAKTVKPTREGK